MPEYMTKLKRDTVTMLIQRLKKHKDLLYKDWQEAADFWDLRVNHVVGEWLNLCKPCMEEIEEAGFGFIEHGSSTSGPVKKPDYMCGWVQHCPKCNKNNKPDVQRVDVVVVLFVDIDLVVCHH